MIETIEALRARLEEMGLHDLRQVGRTVGVKEPTTAKKDELIESIIAIASNLLEPSPRSNRGKPPKSNGYDEETVMAVYALRRSNSEEGDDGDKYWETEETYTGVLEFNDKFWFVRTNGLQLMSQGDVFMHSSFVNRFRLRAGDVLKVRAKQRKAGECPGVTFVVSVNGNPPEMSRPKSFDKLTPCYANRRITLESEGCSLTDRVIDLFTPIGFGQRALIVSPPKAGKTTMLKDIACSIIKNHPHAMVIILLIDERPEEVTDICRSVEGALVVHSTFDKGEQHHSRTAALTLEYAKRQVEMGEDVVLLLDSLTRLTRTYNATSNSGRILTGGLDQQAMAEPKRFFGAARNVEGGGSLTIIATALVDTGSKLDDVIYEEFKSTGNMEIILSRSLAERRVFPAIDIPQSGARKEELLLSEAELAASSSIRSMLSKKLPYEDLLSALRSTESNAEFCAKAQAFLKAYGTK